MRVQVPTVEGIAPPAGAPALSASRWSPVFGDLPEADAIDHFLFGGSDASLIGLKGRLTLAPANPSAPPSYANAFLHTAAGGQNGLVSSLPEPDAFTVCTVMRYDGQDGRGSIIAGTLQGGAGDGKGFGILRGGASDTFQLLARPNGTVTFMPAANIVGARGGWMFMAMTFEVGSRAWKAYVGGASMVSNVLAQAYAKSARNLALGNAYYASSTTPYDGSVAHAEMVVFDHALTQAELDAVYARSRSRMASRGIAIY